MSPKVVDLCYGTGGFSSAFEEDPEWTVLGVDIDENTDADIHADVLDLRARDLPEAQVYLGSPPCPEFSFAGNHDHWDGQNPVHNDARDAVVLARHVATLCETLSTDYWFVENPKGRLAWFLGKPQGVVHYCQYGLDYKKPTYLWGEHPKHLEYKKCGGEDGCHKSNTADDGTKAIHALPNGYRARSRVPPALSTAIKHAVETERTQTTLSEVV